jgi:hypothetical protein
VTFQTWGQLAGETETLVEAVCCEGIGVEVNNGDGSLDRWLQHFKNSTTKLHNSGLPWWKHQ